MDNNNFVIKNSILLTICCFFMINLSNIIFFDFIYDNNIIFTRSFYILTIVLLLLIIIISIILKKGIDIIQIVNNFFKLIHGPDNFIEPFKKFNIPQDGVDIMNYLIFLLPIIFIIMGFVNRKYAIVKNKKNIKFSFINSLVLGILMCCVMFLFFQLIFTCIVNNVTRAQLNTNFNLYLFLFLFTLILYTIIYCIFVNKQKKEQDNNNNNKTI